MVGFVGPGEPSVPAIMTFDLLVSEVLLSVEITELLPFPQPEGMG